MYPIHQLNLSLRLLEISKKLEPIQTEEEGMDLIFSEIMQMSFDYRYSSKAVRDMAKSYFVHRYGKDYIFQNFNYLIKTHDKARNIT